MFSQKSYVFSSWVVLSCKKQTAASHSSTEAEVISLDDGIPALGLWDIVIDVLEPQTQGNLLRHPNKKKHMSKNTCVKQLIGDRDYVPSNTHTHPANVGLCSFSKIMTLLSR